MVSADGDACRAARGRLRILADPLSHSDGDCEWTVDPPEWVAFSLKHCFHCCWRCVYRYCLFRRGTFRAASGFHCCL